MDTAANGDGHVTCAAAFVEGGVQDACEDACSICLEDFSQNDPSTVTNCKHDFHLHCILEWCQRSSNCPMCWQEISLKEAASQELLEAVKQERILQSTRLRNPLAFHQPIHRDFDLQHISFDSNEANLEEQIFQHLAAAAAMRRGHHNFQLDGQRNRSSPQAHRPFLFFEAPSPSHSISDSSSRSSVEGGGEPSAASLSSAPRLALNISDSRMLPVSSEQTSQHSVSRAGMANRQRVLSETRSFSPQSSLGSQDTEGPSDLLSLSDSLRTRFSAWSTRYKESISKNTRGWKERLFARSTSMADVGSEVRREVNAGIASVSRMMERFDSRETNRVGLGSGSSNAASRSSMNNSENRATHMSESRIPASYATSSATD